MTPAEITTLLEDWRNQRAALDTQLDALKAVLHPDPGNPLSDAIEHVFSAYTDTLSALVGDKGDWLAWYWLERDMGAKPGEVIPEQGAAPIVCGADLAALASVITYGIQADEAGSAARITELERKLADAYAAAKQGVQIMATDRRRALDAEAKAQQLAHVIRTIHDLDSTAAHTRELCAVALQESAA